MKFLFTGIFFGTLLVLWGLSLIIETIFGISIPVVKVGFACLLIYGGLLLIKGMYEVRQQKTIFFSQESVTANQAKTQNAYKIVFGQGTIDLSDIADSTQDVTNVQIYTLFGKTILKINPEIATVINATSVFSSVTFPDKTVISLGNYRYSSDNLGKKTKIFVDATAVFSALEVKNS